MTRQRRRPALAALARLPSPGRRDPLLAAVVVVGQLLVWAMPDVFAFSARALDLGVPGAVGGAAKVAVVALSTCAAAGALAVRRIAPVWALAGALTATLLAIWSGGAAVAWPLALVLALYSLAAHRTAGLAAAGAAMTALAAAAASESGRDPGRGLVAHR
ncbi:hypothetical protein AB0J52_22690, partial [Spirillospora sp. NPDC049652]